MRMSGKHALTPDDVTSPSLSRFQGTAQDISDRGNDAIETDPLFILVPYFLDRSW